MPPLVIVFVQVKARGVRFSMAKRATSNTEVCENDHQPSGLPRENGVCCVSALEHGTTCALQLLFSGGNGGMNNFETASKIDSY